MRAKLAAITAEWSDQAYRGAVSRTMPDTALLGNGDVGVTSGGRNGVKTFHLSKGDFWNAHPEPMPAALGGVTIEAVQQVDDSGQSFRETQHILDPRITSEMFMAGARLVLETWLAADRNVVVTEVTSVAGPSVELLVTAFAGTVQAQADYANSAGVDDGVLWASRSTAPGGAWISRAAVATRVLGAAPVGEPSADDDAARQGFVLEAGKTLRIVTVVTGGGRNPENVVESAVAEAGALNASRLRSQNRTRVVRTRTGLPSWTDGQVR